MFEITNINRVDGDQISFRGLWSDEANLEAEQIMGRKMSALNITGSNSKVVVKEVFNSMYELTKDAPKSDKTKAVQEKVTSEVIAMLPNDITRSWLAKTFADTVSGNDHPTGKNKAAYNTWDTVLIPANTFYEDQPAIESTIGNLVFNKFVLQSCGILGLIPYINDTVDKKKLGFIDDEVARLYMEDKITRAQFNSYLDHRDTLGYWLNGMLAHTISERMAKPLKEIERKKAELCKKYAKELAENNVDVMTKISDELVAYAKEVLKDDPGMDLYTSGDLDFGNNYKNNSIIKGAVMNKITGEFDFVSTSFMDGIEVKDIPAHANSILASQYPASIATADAGYMGKRLMALLQMMEVDEDGTDCGTKNLIPISVTKANKKNLLYRWFKEDGEEKLLDGSNIDDYVGKTLMMRSPMSCLGEKICSRCAGRLYYMLGVKHAGLFASQISHAALNLGLKAKHNSVVELYNLDPDKIIKPL